MRTFEARREKLLPFPKFLRRMLLALGLAFCVLFLALGLGILGYHYFAGFDWIDSLLNASMILNGMGPVGELKTSTAKLWASAYALFSGVIFITAMALILAPIFHRLLHKFHLDEKSLEEGK